VSPAPDRTSRAGGLGWAALVATLPFIPGIVRGGTLYFRDLGGQFLPLRAFAVEGLRNGELRYWNPYSYEGSPLPVPPLSYPLDLVHALLPDLWGISLTLALHMPAAAAAFTWLGRRLGLAPVAACAGGIAYALGGFALSTVNLDVYVKALAWSPLLIAAILECAGSGSRRAIAAVAAVGGVAVSTMGVEVVGQALLIGLVLASARLTTRGAIGIGLGLLLAAGLSAPTTLVLQDLTADSARAAGFPTDAVLSQSIHPLSWIQVVVARFHGDLSNITEGWWGDTFFPRGFPYILSLYLGPLAVALAVVGLTTGRRYRWALLFLLALGTWSSLGRWGGLEPLVESLSLVRKFRFPAKAFFTVHASVALLVALGVDGLGGCRASRGWRTLTLATIALGTLLLLSPALPSLAPGWASWFAAGYFPDRIPAEARPALLDVILRDAAQGGAIALAGAGLGLAVGRGAFRPAVAQLGLAGLVAIDLIRAGTGLNPTVAPSFFDLSPEMKAHADRIRETRGRVFTCAVTGSDAYLEARRASPEHHERLTFGLLRDTLSPDWNVPLRIPTGMSPDRTMLVPEARVLSHEDAQCRNLPALLPRLRRAAITHVISLDPLAHPELRLWGTASPDRVRPLRIFIYRVGAALPFADVVGRHVPARAGRVTALDHAPGRIRLTFAAEAPALAVVREAFAPGWTARLDGRHAVLLRADGRHMAVAVPPGRGSLELSYRPPGLGTGVLLAAAAALALLGLLLPGNRRDSESGLT